MDFGNINSFDQDPNPGAIAWSVADQDDADQGMFGRILSGTSGSTPPFNPAGSDTGFWNALGKGLDSALNFTLKRDQMQLQGDLIRSGRAVYPGMYPQTLVGGGDAGLVRLLMIFGIGYVIVKAVK